MPPDHPKRLRPGSSPGIVTPDQPERGTVRHSAVDGAPQELPPHRRGTLNGLGAVRVPGPPPLPLENAPTKPAPANPLEKRTWRLPTPPSALAHARRTDPPAGAEALPTTPEPSAPPGPTSGRAGDREAILDGELAKARATIAELERQARVQAEAASPASFPPAVAPPVVPVPAVVHQGVSVAVLEDYRKAQTKLLLALAALLVAVAAPCALWLTNMAMQAKRDNERAQVQVTEAVKTSEVAKVQTTDANQEIAALKAQRQADQLYFIAVMRKLGVHVRKPDGWPDPPVLTVTAPIRKPGQVDDGTSLTVNTPPAP